MSLVPTSCFVLVCDRCGAEAQGFEDAYTAHFPSADHPDLANYQEPDGQWRKGPEGDICPGCAYQEDRAKSEPRDVAGRTHAERNREWGEAAVDLDKEMAKRLMEKTKREPPARAVEFPLAANRHLANEEEA